MVVLLEDDDGALHALAPGTAKPTRVLAARRNRNGGGGAGDPGGANAGGAGDVLACASAIAFDRRDGEWLAAYDAPNGGGGGGGGGAREKGGVAARHHLYPVHASHAFVFTPTLAAALHLLVARLASRRYAEARSLSFPFFLFSFLTFLLFTFSQAHSRSRERRESMVSRRVLSQDDCPPSSPHKRGTN